MYVYNELIPRTQTVITDVLYLGRATERNETEIQEKQVRMCKTAPGAVFAFGLRKHFGGSKTAGSVLIYEPGIMQGKMNTDSDLQDTACIRRKELGKTAKGTWEWLKRVREMYKGRCRRRQKSSWTLDHSTRETARTAMFHKRIRQLHERSGKSEQLKSERQHGLSC